MRLRVLPPEVGDGPSNMGLDLALLDAVDAAPNEAILRCYRWTEPTLSLGYFQRHEDAIHDARWREVPIVRRPTGGGAIWHDDDLTYALVVPRGHPAASRPRSLYRAVHAALGECLRAAGMSASRRADGAETAPPQPSPFLCFLDRDPEDVVIGSNKVIGSAQRRRPRAVLQHGSILMRSSPATPELPGLDRPAAESIDWPARIAEAVARALDLDAHPGELTAAERESARMLASATFSDAGWLLRR